MSLPRMEVYAFEDQFEQAVQAWLLANGVNDVAKQRDQTVKLEDGTVLTLKTPRVEVKFLSSGLGQKEHYHIVPETNIRWLDLADGTLYLKVVTHRKVSEPSHAYLRGLCRYLMQQVSNITALMKFHKIEKMIEQSSTVTFEPQLIHDVSALSFQTTLRIRPEFFPTT